MSQDKNECCICKEEITGYGNNPAPVAEGRCCDSCNATVVIPERINNLLKHYEENSKYGK